jgi:long-chain acyl-CoA synthetase
VTVAHPRWCADEQPAVGFSIEMADLAQRPAAAVRSLGALALAAADRYTGDAMRAPGRPAITYEAFGRAVREIAGGLASLGVAAGDKVAILCGTIPEWTLADFGAFCAGATVVPVYHTNSPEECEYVLSHSGAKVILLEDAGQAAKVAQVRASLPELEHVVVLTGTAEGALTLDELRSRGAGSTVASERIAAVEPDEPATIVYTSGTTGPPKGCVLTHANLLYVAGAYIDRLELRSAPPIIFQYLPLAHVLARMVSFVGLETGGTLCFWRGETAKLAEDIAEAKPTHIPTVPRLLEKIHTRVVGTAEAAGGVKAAIFKRALATGEKVARAKREGRSVSPLERARHAIGDRLALSRVRDALGPNDPILITGAAPISTEVIEFFYACGVPVLEGYGMTETCAAATLNTLKEVRVGSVGRPLPGTEVTLAGDGEILMRGPHVFKGYHRNEAATAEVMSADGWLHSGDLGEIVDGYLQITGRKKDLIITSSGKNVSPEALESALRETRWISQAIVAGDRRSYLVALVTLDPDEAPNLAAELGVSADPESMARDEKVRAAIWKDIEAVNRRFARIEQIKRFAILPRDLSQEEGELTPTLKVKRAVVYEKYGPQVDALYDATG